MTLEICRICGSKTNLKHIFQEGDDELLDQIRLCANIHIDALDSLPKFVCSACEHGLAFSYRLRKRGEETEKKLRQELLGQTRGEPYHLAEENSNNIGNGFIFIEELQEGDELWIKDEVESSEHFNDDYDFIDHVEESDEDNITKDSCDESEQWIGEEDVLTENYETIKDADVKDVKVELQLVKETDDSNSVTNDFDHTGSQCPDSRNTSTIQIECETCAEVFETRTKYFQHVKEHGDRRYHCVVCDKWFSRRYVFDQHMQNHYSKTGAFPCQKCNKTYTNHWNLERHARSAHRGEKSFRCGQCNSSFGRSDVLKMHMAKHFTERNIKCDICEKKFKTSQSLHFHKKCHLAKSERPKKPTRPKPKAKTKIDLYICDVCEKVSHHRTTHLSHMRTHTGERPYPCSECDKSFKTSHGRSSHMLTHTDQRPHECKICGTSFRQTAHLKSHMLIHEGVKQHVCQVCNKAFRMKCNLIVHSRTHTGELSYKCSKCPEKSNRLTQAKRHKRNHTSANAEQNVICNAHAHAIESDFNDSQMSVELDDIIEISPNVPGGVVISDCVVQNIEYKLDRQLPQVDSTPGVSEEWGSGWNGPDFIVEVQETALNTDLRHADATLNSTNHTAEGPKIIVRTEEVLIVGLVLMLWVGAIVLFFNRWGKIRMLEPYQPKFQQQHRSSCPLVDLDSLQSHPRASVSRMSMGYAGQLNIPACKFATYNPNIYTKAIPTYTRPRQNSVFVGPQVSILKPPRKTRSAMDIHSMVLDESAEHV